MHLAVEDDDDFAMVGRKVAGRFFKRLGALGIQRDVDRIVRRRLAFLINRHARNVGTGHERRVGALGNFEVVALLARGEFVASRVGHGFLRDILTVIDFGLHRFVGETIEAGELELARASDGIERSLGVGKAGNLHENLVVALQRNRCLARAERVNAALNDGARLFHVFAGNGIARSAFRSEHNRQAALNVEALVDFLLRRHKREHRPQNQKHGGDDQPHIAAIHMLRRFLLAVASRLEACCLGFFGLHTALSVTCRLRAQAHEDHSLYNFRYYATPRTDARNFHERRPVYVWARNSLYRPNCRTRHYIPKAKPTYIVSIWQSFRDRWPQPYRTARSFRFDTQRKNHQSIHVNALQEIARTPQTTLNLPSPSWRMLVRVRIR